MTTLRPSLALAKQAASIQTKPITADALIASCVAAARRRNEIHGELTIPLKIARVTATDPDERAKEDATIMRDFIRRIK